MQAHLPEHAPNGLPTNLYVTLVGNRSQTRKSTAKNIAKDVQARTIPNGLMPELASPEGFIEELAERSRDTATWYVDEMGDMLEKLHHAKHMAGLRGLLLTVYDGEDYRCKRKSKRAKGGVAVDDEDVIERPHLCVLAAMTPAVFDTLNEGDVSSGLLPRFAIVMPEAKPARRPFYMVPPDLEGLRSALVRELHGIYVWAKSTPRSVRFEAGALEAIDAFAESIRTAPAAAEYASVIESAVQQASMTLSSAKRELAAIPERVANMTIRDLRPVIHFTADAEKVGIAPFSAAEPGRIRLTVANNTSAPGRLRELCATAEATLASLVRVCEPMLARSIDG